MLKLHCKSYFLQMILPNTWKRKETFLYRLDGIHQIILNGTIAIFLRTSSHEKLLTFSEHLVIIQ
jgi:hypothetical protein